MIVIIGSAEEYHSKFVYELVKSGKEEVVYFDSRIIPEDFISSWYATDCNTQGSICLEGKKIDFRDIKSIYWRWYYGINIQPNSNSQQDMYIAHIVQREFTSYVDSLFLNLDCLWVNSLRAITLHKTKAHQLHTMAVNNIRVPKTLITNDKDELQKFMDEYEGELIFKPVLGGAHTEVMKKEVMTEERLQNLKYSPVKFQEKLEGVDVRVYGLGKKLFPAEIRADSIDFRDDPKAEIVPIEIPEKIRQDCLKIMELFDLKMTGIDIKYNSKTDEYVFIEANPAPMFTHFEKKSGFPISETLVEMLVNGK